MKRITVKSKIIKYGDTELPSIALLVKDKTSHKYTFGNKTNKICFTKVLREFKHDDLVKITITKIGVAKF